MATRHELIHIDFVANAGKANPVLESLQESCNNARIAKENLDKKLKEAKDLNASAEVVSKLETKLNQQTKTWQALERGLREYTKGIDTLSKGIKEFNAGTLDEMSAKFNKAVYNAAKLAQSAVKTGSEDWNQLQRLMDATDRNVVRAREDIDLMMKSLKDGSSVSTIQMTRARDVLQDLSRLAVTNSEEWRSLKAQMNEVNQAIVSVEETERRLKGEIVTENDAIALSNTLTKESISLRRADGEATLKAVEEERKAKEESIRAIQQNITLRNKEREELKDEIAYQETLDERMKKRDKRVEDATARMRDAERRKAEAETDIKNYEEQKTKVAGLTKEKKVLEEQERENAKTSKESASANNTLSESVKKVNGEITSLNGNISNIDTQLQNLGKNPIKPKVDTSDIDEKTEKINNKPIKPKVDTSEIQRLTKILDVIQGDINQKNNEIEKKKGMLSGVGGVEHWKEMLARVEGSNDGRLTPMGLGDEKRQLEDVLDVANSFYEIIKDIKGVSEDGFFSIGAEEPIKRLAEQYKITEEEAKKLIRTLADSEVVQKKFSLRFNDMYGMNHVAVQRSGEKTDQQIRIDTAKEYQARAQDREQRQAEEINKLEEQKNELLEKEISIKAKIAKATEEAANADKKASDNSVNLNKKQQQKVESLKKDLEALTGTIERIREERDKLTDSEERGAEATKKDSEAIKETSVTADQAKAALAKMNEQSTFRLKGDAGLEASNLEQAQQYLLSRIKQRGRINKTGDYVLQDKNEINDVVGDFQDKYGIADKETAFNIVKRLSTGSNGGLLKSGMYEKFPYGETLKVTPDNEALQTRINLIRQYFDISKGVTAADKLQGEVVKELREAYLKENEVLQKRNEEYHRRLSDAERMSGDVEKNNKLTEKGEALQDAEKYRERYVDPQKEKTDKAFEVYQKARTESFKQNTEAVKENTEAANENLSTDEKKKKYDQQIAQLEDLKADKEKQLSKLLGESTEGTKKKTKATKENTDAEEKAFSVDKQREALLKQKAEYERQLAQKKQELANILEKVASGEQKEAKSTGDLTAKTEELNNALAEEAKLKEKAADAGKRKKKAEKDIKESETDIADAKGETFTRKSESEMGQMKKRAAELSEEINGLTKSYNDNALAISNLYKQETDAAIEMAQSENVSIEKIKQAIAVLEKKIQTEATDENTMKARGDAINRLKDRLTEMNAEVARLSKPIADKLNMKDLGKMTETEIRQAIDAAKALMKTYEMGGDKAKELTNNIARADQYLKKHSVESARQAQMEEAQLKLMTKRMDSLGNLSKDALAETKRFWQAMYDGADKSDPKLKAIEGNLKVIAEEERRRNEEVLRASASRLGGNLGSLSSGDLRQAIEDAKQLRGTYAETSKEAQDLANMIVKAEEYAKTHGVEAVRQAHREKEAVRQREEQEQQLAVQMRQRLMERKTLSADALAETRKYWEAQKNGAEDGTIAFRRAEAALKMLDNVERERNAARNEQLAKRLERPEDYKNYTTAELKESINAAKQLALAYKSDSDEAVELTKNIVAAEEHIEKYSVESTRAAKKQADAIEEMTNQLSKGTDLTETALKAQENYWRRLADDPKATNEEMERYIDNMKKAQSLQDDLVAKRGAETLGKAKAGFYDTANMTDLSTAINEIKAYQALIKDPNGAGSETFLAAKKQVDALSAQFNKLKVASESTKTTFASVDEVLQRFHQHLGDGKVEQATQQTEKLAQTLDDKLNAATWKFDDQIKSAAESVDHYEHEIKEAEQELANMEAELEKLEEKHKNSSWFRKQGKDYRLEGRRIDELRRLIEGEEIQMDDGTSFNNGQKAWIQELKKTRDRHQDNLDSWKQRKAEALGLNEAEEQLVSTEEKLLDVRRMTYDELQDGVKMLEQEAMNTDRSTEGGKKRFEELRSTINKMNEEIKVAKGEIMSLDSAMSLSMKSGTSAFEGTAEDLQKAQQAIERAIATTDKGTVKYDRLQKALVRVKAEMSGAGIASQRMKEILSDPKAEKSVDALKNAVARSRAEMDVMGQRIERMQRLLAEAEKNGNNKWAERLRNSIKETTKALDEQAASTKNADQALKELGNTSKGTASSFEKAWSRLKTYVTLYMGAAVAIQKLTKTMGDLMDLSDKMGEVRKTTGFTAEEVGKLSENLKKMDVRTPLVQLMEVSAAAGQLGLKTLEDVQGFTEAANKLMIALPEMGKEAATEMMRVAIATGEVDKIRRQMQDGTIEGSSATAVAMEKIASTIDRLRATSASTAPEITDFVKRVGAVGAQSGITIDQVAALGSTISSLGMRVEMSATAISRMIPAIKNNAFDVARAIGMVPNDLRAMFDEAGGGMNAVLAILQHIKDAGMDADSIEKMLGMGGMQEVMKELNQQGARAGIVFAGLSQNVDELRRQLTVATGAYEDNIAVQQEFDKMNETTAAKWERLKNQVEEAFVSDYMQSLLGSIIDGLRKIVDLITGDVSGAWKLLTSLIWSAAAAMAAFKFGLGEGLAMLKNLILVIATPSGWKRIIVSMQKAIGVTRMYIAANWQLAFSHDATAKAAARATLANNALAKSMKANAIMAVVAALGMLIWKLVELNSASDELDETFAKLQADEAAAERDVNRLKDTFSKTSSTLENTTKKHEELKKKTEDLRKEVDEMKKSTDLSADAQKNLEEKTDELKKSEDELKKATDEMNKAKKDHSGVISDINSKYSSYLGYMLSEVTNADLVASAHQRIVAALRAELEKKRQLANQEAVEKKYDNDIAEWTKNSREELSTLPRDVQDRIMRRRSNLMAQVSYDIEEEIDKEGKKITKERWIVPAIDGIGNQRHVFTSEEGARNYLKKLTSVIVKQETVDRGVRLGKKYKIVEEKDENSPIGGTKRVMKYTGRDMTPEEFVNKIWGGAYGSLSPDDGFQRLTTAELLRMQEMERQRYQDQGAVEGAQAQENQKTLKDIMTNAGEITKTIKETKELSDKQVGEMGRQLNAVLQSSLKYGGSEIHLQQFFGNGNEVTLENAAGTLLKGLDEKTQKKVIEAAKNAERAAAGGTTTPTYTDNDNPFGDKLPAESTDYKDMAADALVNRRKQMKDFVNAIQTDSDIKSVLAEDKALKKAIENGMSSDMRTVIEWYNTERLKIQDELNARHLTNTGDWKDPKQEKARKKRLQDDMKAYLEELDAYYTERKAKIQEARNDEEISEAEAWNRDIKNEAEWHRRRAELQKLYADKAAEVTKEEQDAIYDIIADRTEDSVDFIRKTVAQTVTFSKQIRDANAQGAREYRRFQGDLQLGWEKDFLKQRQALGRHLKAIEEIVNKERPFNGIAESLRENLGKMDILTADLGDDVDSAADELKRVTFLLGEAENAYTMTVEQLLDDMHRNGFKEWADAVSKDTSMQQGLLAMLRQTFDSVQDAIKKESSIIKKQVDIMFEDIAEQVQQEDTELKILENSVRRANSLIGAGAASERVADKLVIKQIQMQITMQETRLRMLKKRGDDAVKLLSQEADLQENNGEVEKARQTRMDAENVAKSVGLTLTKDQIELDKQRVALAEKLEESQNRLYVQLKEWGDLLTSSLQSMMEASNAGNAEYYDELAKLNLTGKGGPGAGTYVVIDNAGTEDATAHYEYLDERAALERQREIEQENARAEAWKKVLDDISNKMNDTITDQLNAMLQNQSIDANTDAIHNNTDAEKKNTEAIVSLTNAIAEGNGKSDAGIDVSRGVKQFDNAAEKKMSSVEFELPTGEFESDNGFGREKKDYQDHVSGDSYAAPEPDYSFESTGDFSADRSAYYERVSEAASVAAEKEIEASDAVRNTVVSNIKKEKDANDNIQKSTQSTFAKMTQAANLYGIAYQTMSNDNLDATQKFEMFAIQAAGNAAITMLTTDLVKGQAKNTVQLPGILGELLGQMPYPAAMATFAIVTALMGGLMGLAVSQVAKSKSQIAQATGAGASAGRLTTGMLTYAEGNVNEFTDPSSLTPGRQYNVDASDGKTYRARYMGSNPRTHITNGPEFHLSGEKGREMIIDAGTTRQITMNDTEIWHAIQTISEGNRSRHMGTRRRGVHAFAQGNINDFDDAYGSYDADVSYGGMTAEQMAAFQASLDRNNELLERALRDGIKGVFNVFGNDGLVATYDRGKKTVTRHGEKY